MLPIIHVSLRKNNKESGNTEGHRGIRRDIGANLGFRLGPVRKKGLTG